MSKERLAVTAILSLGIIAFAAVILLKALFSPAHFEPTCPQGQVLAKSKGDEFYICYDPQKFQLK